VKLGRDVLSKVVASLRETQHVPAGVAADMLEVPVGGLELADAARQLSLPRELILKGLAHLANIPIIDMREISPAPSAIEAFPEDLARRFRALPLFLNKDELTIAVGNPSSWSELDEVRRMIPGLDPIFVLADEVEIAGLLDMYYPSAAEAAVREYLIQADGPEATAARLKGLAERAPIVKMLETILARAALLGASDVHLEPYQHMGVVRFRLDGLMTRMFAYHGSLHEPLISRLKVLCDLNIMERNRPQDGRFSIKLGERIQDARVSVLRMVHGEKAVVRLLRGELASVLALEGLGMPSDMLADLKRLLGRPYGMLLVTGPTGSGKTSTLYAALQHLNNGQRNLVSLEDPVEAPLAGINQVPIRPDVDLTFATALRAVLRQDPDVIMVGEIRDQETAEIAVRASLTGHMVLATLHTNDATETITRLLEMGLDGGNLAPALLGVVAQRLVRKLCDCHGYEPTDPSYWAALGAGFLGDVPRPVPRGCVECHQSGYRGRQVIFELLIADDAVRRQILAGTTSAALRDAAIAAGMRTLAASGLREVMAGKTSVDEILRVVNADA
jgi:type II secretory ATPase GspE/PulE/Tfp pilus assembly ATPase PilB-like protein